MKRLPELPKHPLNARFKQLGITRSQLAVHLSRPISTVSAWLNGYAPMPRNVESALKKLLAKLEAAGSDSTGE